MVIIEIEDSSEKRAIIERCDKSFVRPITKRDNYEEIFSKIDNYAVFYAAFEEDAPTGFAALYANDTKTKSGYISLLAVVEEMQHKYIGSALMQKCIDRSIENGMACIRLEVLLSKEVAIRFYEHWGFKYERDSSEGNYIMIKQLT